MSAKAPLLYRLLLHLLPPRFRRDFGADIEAVLVERLRDAPGSAGRAWIWLIAVVDVFTSAPSEWAHVLRHQRTGNAGRSSGMRTMIQDLRYAVRSLARRPGFTAIAVITLALGIGANTAIFGAIDAILLKPLPYPDPDRVLTVWQHDRSEGLERGEVAPANFLDWRERSQSFEALAAIEPYTVSYVGPESAGPESIRAWRVSEGFFDVFAVPALIGRTFLPEEHLPGGQPAVVLSHWLWQSRFRGDTGVLGRTLNLAGQPATVVGVMPPEFALPPGRDVWASKAFAEWEQQARGVGWWQVVGRLTPGVSVEAAQAELDAIASQLEIEFPQTNTDIGISAVPLREQVVGHTRPALILLLAAVGLVLLIACVNVANLLLARAANRQHEFAIRAVLGASRGRVIRQLITESVVLAGFGSLVGLLIARWGLNAFRILGADTFPRVDTLGIDGRVVAFAVSVALATALLFGLAPALHVARAEIRAKLQPASQSATLASRRFRGGLVVAELALAMVLLIGAGLLVRSFVALLQVERGYRTENLLAITVQAWSYQTPVERSLFVQETLDRIGGLPGVEAAGVTSSLPLAEVFGGETATFTVEGQPAPTAGQEPVAHTAVVTNGYFAALGIPLRQGRLFESTDGANTQPVVLVNETMAARYWSGESPIGRRITHDFTGTASTAEVIGIVGDVRHAGLDDEPRPTLFLPHAQASTGALAFTVRTVGDPARLARTIQEEVWSVSPALPIPSPVTLEGLLADSLRERRFNLFLLLSFSLTALTLAAVGAYGLLSYESNRRSREIGLRMALGVARGRVLWLVVGEGLRLSFIGVGIGTILALATTRLLAGFLFGVSTLDPFTFVGIALLLTGVTVIASYVPARRATRVDPVVALRAE